MSRRALAPGAGALSKRFADSLQPIPVPGVEVGALAAGIRYEDRLDLVAIRLCAESRSVAVFTRNAFCAAPVIVAREHLETSNGAARVLLINTGNANAGTGSAGEMAARECCAAAAHAAGFATQSVLPFSTGVIGEDLPVAKIIGATSELLDACNPNDWVKAATGIMTTDTLPKAASRRFGVGDETFALTGIAKGAGMLRPNMATMLAFFATDAPIASSLLQSILAKAVEQSFHRITVDGDTSTNDAVVLSSTGSSCLIEDAHHPVALELARALNSLSLELAQGLVRDGEGASKFIEITVDGGNDARECLDVAFVIAHSPLVKTALFAADPNWGRLLAAIGRAGIAALDVSRIRISIGNCVIAEAGARAANYDEAAVAAFMAQRDVVLNIDLGRGEASETVWTCDLGYEYVRINAEYRS